jgi:cellulose synthase/poly-beta-1,6-N-acetylglucosamine synthase-like glycosyltransferase
MQIEVTLGSLRERPSQVEDTLSIVVPIRDAEAVIGNRVHDLLDLAPDLTSQFEILIVDDASRDHTAEIVGDLARQYPQVKLIVQKATLGLVAAGKTGLAAATGDTIFVQEDMTTVSANDLRRLWSLRKDRALVVARTEGNPSGLSPELIERLSTWGQSLRNTRKRLRPGGLQMIRRDGAQSLEMNGVSVGQLVATVASPSAAVAANQ